MCKCNFVGCSNEVSHVLKHNWGKDQKTKVCKDHAPDWVKAGLSKSPEAVMFGVKKSWYELEGSI